LLPRQNLQKPVEETKDRGAEAKRSTKAVGVSFGAAFANDRRSGSLTHESRNRDNASFLLSYDKQTEILLLKKGRYLKPKDLKPTALCSPASESSAEHPFLSMEHGIHVDTS
jgi:hypothetical protein